MKYGRMTVNGESKGMWEEVFIAFAWKVPTLIV
jgi:hypothetical protein